MTVEAAAQFSLPLSITDVPYAPVRLGLVSPESAEAYTAFFEAILRGGQSGTVVFQQRYLGEWRWLEARSATVFSDTGEPVKAVIFFTDVTERLEKEAIYKKWKQSFSEKKPDSYTLYRYNLSKNTMLDATEGALLSYTPKTEVYSFNQRTEEYAALLVQPEDRARFVAFMNADRLLAAFRHGEHTGTLEYREQPPAGGERWLRLTVELVEYAASADVEAFLMFEDIDQVKRAELQAVQQAQNDPLTGVLNRKTFFEEVDALIRQSPATQSAFFMLDLDGFKLLNDSFGHAAGDEALIEVAGLLRAALRRGDLLGRLGGDEFVIFLSGIADETSIARKADQLCQRLRKTYSVEVSLSVSIGVAVCPRDGTDARALYEKADAALYLAKDSGKNRYHFHSAAANAELADAAPENGIGSRVASRRRMLIVDDSAADAALLAGMFQNDFQIEQARDGSSALARMRHYGAAISVVLLDLAMAGMSGFEVLERMQRTAEMRGIPVIVVSANEDRETQLRAIRGGASDYIQKPVDAALLRLRVSAAVSRAENERLRAQNSYLQHRSNETSRYQIALAGLGCFVVEQNWVEGTFIYDADITRYLKGNFDSRGLWRILLSDMVADVLDVKKMQELVYRLSLDRTRFRDSIELKMKSPTEESRLFRMTAAKVVNDYQLTEKLILTFQDLGAAPQSAP